MMVPYEVRSIDKKNGNGLVAKADILKGSKIWVRKLGENVKLFDATSASTHLSQLSSHVEQVEFLDRTYGYDGKLVLILDDGKFMNHSTTPNCFTPPPEYGLDGTTLALRDIQSGEELLEDYMTFEHPSFLPPLLEKYCCAPDYYVIDDVRGKELVDLHCRELSPFITSTGVRKYALPDETSPTTEYINA